MNRERVFTRFECVAALVFGFVLGWWMMIGVDARAKKNQTPKPATTDVRHAFNAGVMVGAAQALQCAMESATQGTNRPVRLQGTNVLNTIYQRAYDMFPEFRPPAKGGG